MYDRSILNAQRWSCPSGCQSDDLLWRPITNDVSCDCWSPMRWPRFPTNADDRGYCYWRGGGGDDDAGDGGNVPDVVGIGTGVVGCCCRCCCWSGRRSYRTEIVNRKCSAMKDSCKKTK